MQHLGLWEIGTEFFRDYWTFLNKTINQETDGLIVMEKIVGCGHTLDILRAGREMLVLPENLNMTSISLGYTLF